MTAAVVTMSHSPLIGRSDPNPAAVHRIYSALGQARDFVADFAPELVVLYVPDHYNAFFHKTMPQFCLGVDAYSVGDFGSRPGPLLVDTVAAELLAQGVLDRGIDPAISARMPVDHGFVQPTKILFGGIDRMLVVPVFINGVAAPFGLPHRIRSLGLALGQAARELQKQVLFVGSGGLSNDLPMPSIMSATQRVAEPLIEGHPTPEQRARIEHRVLVTGVNYRAGARSPIPINPHWDNHVLDVFEHGTSTRSTAGARPGWVKRAAAPRTRSAPGSRLTPRSLQPAAITRQHGSMNQCRNGLSASRLPPPSARRLLDDR